MKTEPDFMEIVDFLDIIELDDVDFDERVDFFDEPSEIADPIGNTDPMQVFNPSLTRIDVTPIEVTPIDVTPVAVTPIDVTPIDIYEVESVSRISETDSTFGAKINSDLKENSMNVGDNNTSDLNARYTGHMESIEEDFRVQSRDLMKDASSNLSS